MADSMTDNTVNTNTVLDFNAKVSESSEAGETFYKLFYEYLDKKRTLISHFYADDSIMLWNGNVYTGSSEINSFYQTLPPSVHVLLSVDCQPVPDISGEQSTVIVICEGEVQYEGSNNQAEIFSHHFVLKKVGDVWKVTNDTFRFTNFT